MSSHLSPLTLSALADGELPATELASVNEHLAGCPSCTSQALSQSLLKSATTRAAHRYAPPADLQKRLARIAATRNTSEAGSPRDFAPRSWSPIQFRGWLGWLATAAVLLTAVTVGLVQYRMTSFQSMAEGSSALIAEAFDQHIATLAAGPAPQVISTDRHTVKPWFQGKLPFSFNLPENLPANTTLDGANLSYLDGQPVAQLLYSIGKHRVSVFVRERSASTTRPLQTDRSGFHVEEFETSDLQAIAISDVDPVRLRELVAAIRQAQNGVSSR